MDEENVDRGRDDADSGDEAHGSGDEDSGHGDHAHDDHAHDDDHGTDDHHGDHETDDPAHHDHHRHDVVTVSVGIVTVSSTRSLDDDPSGDAIEAAFEDDGHVVAVRELIADDYDGVQGTVDNLVGRDDVDCVVTTGGTGVTPDDVTVEAVRPLLDKVLPGFGELFRRLSTDEIGTRSIATRTVAGVSDGVPIFCLPGSENAARLGATEIIVPEAGHLVGLASFEEV